MESALTEFEISRKRAFTELDTELSRIESILTNDATDEDAFMECDMILKRIRTFHNQYNMSEFYPKLVEMERVWFKRFKEFQLKRKEQTMIEKREEVMAGPRGDFIREFGTRLSHHIEHEEILKMAMRAAYKAPELSAIESLFMKKSRKTMDEWYVMDEDSSMSTYADEIHDWVESERKVVDLLALMVPNYCEDM